MSAFAPVFGKNMGGSVEEKVKELFGQLSDNPAIFGPTSEETVVTREALQAAVENSEVPASIRDACRFLLNQPNASQIQNITVVELKEAARAAREAL